MSTSNALRFKPHLDRASDPVQPSPQATPQPVLPAPVRALPEAPASPTEARKPADGELPSARKPDAPAPEVGSATPSKPRSTKKFLIGGAAAVVLSAASWFAYDYVMVGQYIVSTDDAYVGADMALISPKVAANVALVPISENQHVKLGDTLVQLDDGDYRLAVDQADAKLATQTAAIATFDAQIRAGIATASQARAQFEASKATVLKAVADYERTKPLADSNYSSKATLDAAIAARDTARAQSNASEAAIETADANVALLRSQRRQAEQVAKELEVDVAKAKRDLSFTVIRAPFDGVIGNRNVQVGDYVTPGKRLAAVVPMDKVYVDANVKETQLAGVAVGDKATVRVDALGGRALEGTVESIAPASGSQFSLLPPENATGNFTKIVQRVPIRIAVSAAESDGKLRPGLSVVVDIDTRKAADTTPNGAVPPATSRNE